MEPKCSLKCILRCQAYLNIDSPIETKLEYCIATQLLVTGMQLLHVPNLS